jgi:UDP-N-acetylmuramoyl-tripeptide--D-alanyl-D-alanine ligase
MAGKKRFEMNNFSLCEGWTLSKAAELIGAEWAGEDISLCRSFRADTREIQPGDVFWALPGEKTDGHQYLEDAIERGAGALVISPVHTGLVMDRVLDEGIPVILVGNTQLALKNLARERLKILRPECVLAITGTVGKTTTREMVRAVAENRENVHCARRSFNTWIGCSLTVLDAPPGTRVIILEMGTNHPGEIGEMASMFRPDYGIIPEVGEGHLEGLGDIEGVLSAKMELAGAGSLEVLSYNSDNKSLSVSVGSLAGTLRRISVGRGDALYRIISSTSELIDGIPFLSVEIMTPTGCRKIRTRVFGDHNAFSMAFAMAAGDHLGIMSEAQIGSLEKFKPMPGRGVVRLLPGGVIGIDDTYNANPLSMIQALRTLSCAVSSPKSKKIAVLGGMGELGSESERLHRETASIFEKLDEVFLYGETWMDSLEGRLPHNTRHFDDIEELAEALQARIISGDVVLFKGSRSFRMERVIAILEGAR